MDGYVLVDHVKRRAWMDLGVSKKNGTPKSSILMVFSMLIGSNTKISWVFLSLRWNRRVFVLFSGLFFWELRVFAEGEMFETVRGVRCI